jgi:hypothetical protein
MDCPVDPIKRAYQLAQIGDFVNFTQIEKAMRRECNVDRDLDGAALHIDLTRICREVGSPADQGLRRRRRPRLADVLASIRLWASPDRAKTTEQLRSSPLCLAEPGFFGTLRCPFELQAGVRLVATRVP